MREKNVEQKLRQAIEYMGGKAYKLESPSESGMPDRLICLPDGKVYFVETKRPKGGRLSKRQIYVHQQLGKLGHAVKVIKNFSEIDKFIEEVKQCDSHRTSTKST